MDQNISLEVKNISKKFNMRQTTFYGGVVKSGTKQIFEDISFDLKNGEVLGIIGKNGSGKSTLLKILTGIIHPDAGTINSNGKIASILELGMGFDSEATGRDNIFIKCGLYGLTNAEINECVEEIIAFSEIGDQIDQPLRTYSSGMIAKLAFSVLIYVKCDILIIDEVLSVGDASFNAKCKLAFNKLKKSGRSIILASHNLHTLESMSDRIMWIDEGCVKEIGDPSVVCYHYQTDISDSLDTVKKMAESGNVSSINRAGEMYRDGIGTVADLSTAEAYFKKAADMGHIESYLNLAELKLKKEDKNTAIALYKKAADMGNSTAITMLMQLTENSTDVSELINKIKKMANSGNIRSMRLLADILYSGTICPRNFAESIEWYTHCANNFDNRAQLTLAIAYRDGIGVQKDLAKSIKWFEIASEHGNTKAMLELANMYRKGAGVDKNIKLALKWYECAAESGDQGAMLQLGQIYQNAEGIDANMELAEAWLKRYSMQAISNYEYELGDILKHSCDETNQKDAIFWYNKAAECGHIRSMNVLGGIYNDGEIVPCDTTKSAKYYSLSADMKDLNGLYELAMLHYKGNGVKRDIYIASQLMKQSAMRGHSRATYQYCRMYKEGLIDCDWKIIQNMLKWLKERGNIQAKNLLDDMTPTIKKDE